MQLMHDLHAKDYLGCCLNPAAAALRSDMLRSDTLRRTTLRLQAARRCTTRRCTAG